MSRLFRGQVPVTHVLDVYVDLFAEQLCRVLHAKVEAVLPPDYLDRWEGRDDPDVAGLGQRASDEPFQIQGLILPGEEPDKVPLCGEIAGDDGSEINIRVLIRDFLQRHPHELGVSDDDVGAFRDQLFRVGDGDVRSHFLSVDIIYIWILFGEPLPGAVVGARPGGPLNDTESARWRG